MGYSFKQRKERGPNDSLSPLVEVNTYIPRSMYEQLRNYSYEKEIPQSRLIAYALYNEMYESAEPFKFETRIPDFENIHDGQFLKEAELLLGLIRQFPKGAGLDMLIMAREMIRLSYDHLLLAYRELVNKELVTQLHPTSIGIHGQYHKDYFHVMIKNQSVDTRKSKNRQAKPSPELNARSPLSELNPQIKK